MFRVLSNLFSRANAALFGTGLAVTAYCGYIFLTTGADFWMNLAGVAFGSLLVLYEYILAIDEGLIKV